MKISVAGTNHPYYICCLMAKCVYAPGVISSAIIWLYKYIAKYIKMFIEIWVAWLLALYGLVAPAALAGSIDDNLQTLIYLN